MSYCLNPNCLKPASNPFDARFCQSCGAKLLLKERYRAIRLIGQGGFSRTFLATDEDKPSKPRCAIKQFFYQGSGDSLRDSFASRKAAELFEREAIRLDELGKHPQIPDLFAHFEQESRLYIVQEFIDGQNLAQELAETGAFSETKICNLLEDLLPVLQFIHAGQVIHRDIKPENIIRRSADGKLVLVDFGAAKYASSTNLGKTGTTIGSAGYAAPEQSFGKAVFASDLYSLGVTCIHLLTQIEPFDLYDVSESAFVWQDYLVNNPVSDRLAEILDKMIESSVKHRYQSVEEARQSLKPSSAPRPKTFALSQTPALNSKISSVKVALMTTLSGHLDAVYSVAISPDGSAIASGSADRTIKLWPLNGREDVRTLMGGWFSDHSNIIYRVIFSPDGQTIASSSTDKTIKLWHVRTGKLLCTLKGHSNAVIFIDFSPDGQTLASGSQDGTIKRWDVASRQEKSTFNVSSKKVYSVAFSPDGHFFASGDRDNIITLWEGASGKPKLTLKADSMFIHAIAFSPDGKMLASGGSHRTIQLWDVASGKEKLSLQSHADWVRCVAFSPDGQMLASSSDDRTVKLWDVKTGRELCTLEGHSDWVRSVAFSPDGQILVSGSKDRTIKIWQIIR